MIEIIAYPNNLNSRKRAKSSDNTVFSKGCPQLENMRGISYSFDQ